MLFNKKFGARLAVAGLPVALAVAFTGAGTAAADDTVPAQFAAGLTSAGAVDGVGFATAVSSDLSTVSAELDAGRFSLSPDNHSVVIASDSGAVLGSIPTAVSIAGGEHIDLGAAVSEDGRSLELNPTAGPAAAAVLQSIATNPGAAYPDPILNGAAAGAAIGAIAGAILCLPALAAAIVGYIPCAAIGAISNAIFGAVIGALIGAFAPDVIPQVLP